ncbi:glycosyltransferase family 4 protein [Loktanella sp. 3ANDIMAR09]|uniref:glycosyltransferase family 4 protein n=1 Tax=Loktanella sp. 3ANDIMAR09 TaxID=1225657 RepID=UPI0006F37D4D|nr:glycosyltransferase family 4 protein [Loktanella sp. 3ANDIMAR09]
MKLLFLTVIPSPYQRQLFTALAARGDVDVQVFYFTAGAHDRSWAIPDLHPFETILPGRTLTRLGPSAHWNPGIMGRIAQADPDLVIVSDYSAVTAQVAMRGMARRGLPFVFWGEVPGFSTRGQLGTFLRRQLQAPLRHARAIAAMGSVAVPAYRALCPGLPVANIPYFCDLAPFRAARDAATTDPDTIDVLFSGQMIPRKGFDVLLTAFDRVARSHPQLRIVALGGGPAQDEYAAAVPADLRDRVVFLGHRDPADLPQVFAAADLFCLPSRHDGWGVVVNEALGAGLPVLVSDAVGAGPDLVQDGETGFITPAGDADALAQVLDRLAGDAALRARMTEAVCAAAARWDVDEGARRWASLAHDLLGPKA